jgi:hypothetical protein
MSRQLACMFILIGMAIATMSLTRNINLAAILSGFAIFVFFVYLLS